MTIVFPERVVALTLFAVAQDLVGFGNRLELLLNRIALAFRMTIRVPFFGKLAIGPLNLIITGASRHAEGAGSAWLRKLAVTSSDLRVAWSCARA